MVGNVPSILLFISGLIQLVFFIWMFVFPIIIIKKLGEIARTLKNK
ncbi:MAG: hypothetical protein PHI86_05245 [Candidatus Omnitrophica bacterium]|nr:hypothetical protein [Candidatus Omnitrophota bacterium]HOX54617.1 hypothetical protein [Candidatus Omnitrophota bacterium]